MDKMIKPQEGPQEQFLSTSADIAFFGGSAGGGKALCLNTPIPTISGWKTMGTLCVGDQLFDEKGNTCKVTHLFSVIEKPIAYRLTFDDLSTIDCCEDHLWLTFDAKELSQLTKSDDEWKAKRRSKRPSRSKGTRSSEYYEYMAKRNLALAKSAPPPTGTVRTVKEIVNTLKLSSGRSNHAIPVSHGLNLPDSNLPIAPYVLGAWLGDGTSTSSNMTGIDPQIMDEIRACGYEVIHHMKETSHRVTGLITELKKLNLNGNKHIPIEYLRASRNQRIELLQGLMDTDGTVTSQGVCEFTNTNKMVANGVLELIHSLGWKSKIREGRAKLYGKDCGAKYTIKWSASDYVFKLERKKAIQKLATRRTTKFRYIINADPIESKPMRCIAVDSPSRLFLCGNQMIPTHNSFVLLMEAARHTYNPAFGALLFRRTYPQIFQEGGLWDTSQQLYPHLDADPIEGKALWRFPSGSTVRFMHMQHEKDIQSHQGGQYPMIGFDELTHFSEKMFLYLISRNRSACGVKPYVRGTCNPDSQSWVRKFIDWWIGPDGFAIEERSGVIRWFIKIADEIIWADTKEELIYRYADKMPIINGERQQVRPKSFTFIRSKLSDNKILMEKDPDYLANLMMQDHITRAQLLDGNWNITANNGIIKSEWIKTYRELPYVNYYVWSWDTAIKKGQHNDYSVGQLWAVCHNGFYLVEQWRNKVEYASLKNMVKSLYAQTPSSEVLIEDKASGQQLIQDLKSDSTLPVIAMMPGKNMALDKISRVQMISPSFEAGKIYLPDGKPWLAEYIMELTNFPEVEHDDQCDATSQAIKRMTDRHKFEVEHATPETVKEAIGEPSYMETDHGEDDGYW